MRATCPMMAQDYRTASRLIRKADGVLSDVHFPFSLINDVESGQDYSEPTACGITIALECQAEKIPFVLCTDGWHHGNKAQWVFETCKIAGWDIEEGNLSPEMVEDKDSNPYADTYLKPWIPALHVLLAKMQKEN